MPAPSTAENATSAIPIMSAAAVAAVRPGLRMALRRASTPAEPAIRAPGPAERGPASPGTSRGEISATAMNRSSAPGASSARRPSTSMPGAEQRRGRAPPARAPPVIAANSGARRPMRPGGMSAPSRIAGHRRDARGAQRRAEARHHRHHDAHGERHDRPCRVLNTVLVDGRSMPADANTLAEQLGEPEPAATPITEATVPIASASTTTERSTWRRVAPSARMQRELARALRDGDRERVVDRERADEHGDSSEHEQEDLQELTNSSGRRA